VVDDDDVADDDDFTPPVDPCESGPDEAAPIEAVAAAMDVPADLVLAIDADGTPPGAMAVRTGLGLLCTLVGEEMALLSTGDAATIESREDHDWPGSGPDGSAGDRAALRLQLQAPADAQSFVYHFLFLTREYPEWVGSAYGDAFEATVTGLAYSGPAAFGGQGEPIDSNWFAVQVGPKGLLDPALLIGSGFDEDGGTGWYEMRVPVAPGEPLEVMFEIYDVADGVWDSAVLLDGFEFSAEPVAEPTPTYLWP